MRVHAFLLSAPLRRFIGSELMTFGLLEQLRLSGHRVTASVADGAGAWTYRGIPVTGVALDVPRNADLVVVHAGLSWPGVEYRARRGVPLVMVCHNISPATVDDLHGAKPDLVVVNSETMRDELGVDALVVNPPAPPVREIPPGDRVVALSLNELKGGPQFFELAAALADVPFLAVRGGYGDQVAADLPNVELVDHVPHEQLAAAVWSQAGVFLQLSSSESWGMAASEALAHGVPVIAHPTPGLVENLAGAAVWVDRDDIPGIAAAVREVLAHRPRHAAAARVRALEHAAASEAQMREWVAAIERLGHEADQRDGAVAGVHAGSR